MWVWYWVCRTGMKKEASGFYLFHTQPSLSAGVKQPSESCMMIPGAYAQMREDYD